MSSAYEEMFGEAKVGRPVGTGEWRGGDRAMTEAARRRARRVLMERHWEEFEELFKEEMAWLEKRAHAKASRAR